MSSNIDFNNRPDHDRVIQDIADYVLTFEVSSEEALDTARNCLIDTLGCRLLALRFPECTKHLGPIVQGTVVPNGARVPGTSLTLDPVKTAWDIGCIIRWLDYNDTWLAAEWGHPSDNLGGILAIADHLSQVRLSNGERPLIMREVLEAMVMAEYLEENKRSIANAIQIFFKDGSTTQQVVVEYPVGHRRRREEGNPLLELKFKTNLASRFPNQQCRTIFTLYKDQDTLENTPVNRFMDLFIIG